ncbi:MAG: IS21-like element helper ATPase IstB [Clostridiales bacterium]|nr:IS21-like element helper ATPase IstB [Clostridiales bacterium]
MTATETELFELCKRMRLSRNLAERALEIEACGNIEFLLKLFSEELAYRDARRNEGLVKAAGFYSVKTLKGFITDDIQFPAGAGLEELKTLDFIKDKWNICMYGGTGTGKTLLSTALGVRACESGIPIKFYRTAALVNSLSEAKASGTLSKVLNKIDKAQAIVLDEFGYVPVDRVGAQLLFEVISECYERKSVILNTNLEFSQWVNILYDQKMTAALIARLLHHCHLLIFTGPDMRLKESSIHDMYAKIAG